jgi:cysteine desulfuration protein SufE
MTITEIQDEIIEDFAIFDNKNDTYNYIIELGKNLSPYPEVYRSDEYLIKGCQSKVWVYPYIENNQLKLYGDSDSTLVKGIVSLLVRVLSNQSPKTVLDTNLYFIEQIGLKQLLSMNRSNGLASMVKQIKLYALAFQTQIEQNH